MNPENTPREHQRDNQRTKSTPLPSRSELRAKKKKKRKSRFPLIKILAAFFIVMPVAIYFLLPYLEKHPISLTQPKKTSGFETVELKSSSEQVETNKETDPAVTQPEVKQKSQEKSVASASKTKNNKDTKDGYQIVYHTVQPKESLFLISMNYYKSAEEIDLIKEWNHLKGNELQVGQLLKIPLKEED